MSQSVIRFGEFELDSDRCQLRRGGRPQKLERIPMELLTLLVENRGKVVSREAIIDRLWGKDVFLETEHSINTAINKVRRVLRDDPGNPRFVQTVFGKGYRFLAETTMLPAPAETVSILARNPGLSNQAGTVGVADGAAKPSLTDQTPRPQPPESVAPANETLPDRMKVQTEDQDPTQQKGRNRDQSPDLKKDLKEDGADRPGVSDEVLPDRPAPSTRISRDHSLAWALVAVLLLVALTSVLTLRLAKERSARATQLASGELHSIAVLPLANLSNEPEQEYLVDGMTDQLITDLARATPLRVISRTSTMQYKGMHKPLPEIARDLNVDAIVEGSVLPSQGSVRITAQLLDARKDQHLWAESYERSQQDLLAMQDEVAQDIVHEIAATLQPTRRPPPEQQNVNAEAYDRYLHGLFLWNRRTLEDLNKSIDYYQQAIQLAPKFAAAYAALGDVYAVISYRGGPSPSDSYPRARAAAEKALQLDSSLADAHALLGEVKVNYDFDWEGGEKEFQRATDLNPNYPTAHHWYAIHLALMKRPQEAETEIEKASLLDPLSLVINGTRSEILYWARDPDSAIRVSLHAQELDPTFAETYVDLGRAYELKGQFREANVSFKKAVDLSKGAPKMLMLQAHAYVLSGRKDLAAGIVERTLSSRHGYLANSDVAAVYCAMGKTDTAMTWLERGLASHEEGMNQLAVEPLFDGCRRDPRFQSLIQQLKLPQ
jgi:TolB-like protein/DNA-binding winged helix-turn-helix (wHTH) protein/Flp pilus assembly protein TadD